MMTRDGIITTCGGEKGKFELDNKCEGVENEIEVKICEKDPKTSESLSQD